MLFECFLAFFSPRSAKEHSKSTLWSTPSQAPQRHSKSIPWGTFRPGAPEHSCIWRPGSQLKIRVTGLAAHDCGYPLSRSTCRATRVAADFVDFTAFCRCSSGVAPHPLKIWCRTFPPPFPGGVAPKFGSEKVSRYTGVSQVQLRVSRYTVQLRLQARSRITDQADPRIRTECPRNLTDLADPRIRTECPRKGARTPFESCLTRA